MTVDRELELVSAAIDGDLGTGDQAKLNALLENSMEARKFKSDLEQLDSLMSNIPDLEPPKALYSSITARTQATGRNASIMEWLRALQPSAGLRYALAAAVGALVVAVLFDGQTMLLDETDITDLVGTMAPVNASAGANIVDSFSIRGDGLESLVQLQRREEFMLLVVRVDAVAPIDILVDFAGAGLVPDAVSQINSEFESIVIGGQALQMRALGRQRMSILLRRVDDTAFAGEASRLFIPYIFPCSSHFANNSF